MQHGTRKQIGKGRLKPGTMNRLEAKYAETLTMRQQAGDVAWFRFEAVKLRLADNTTYTPDFFVMLADGSLEVHEVKGFWENTARIKIKVAAEHFPFRFIAVKAIPKKDGGGWSREEF